MGGAASSTNRVSQYIDQIEAASASATQSISESGANLLNLSCDNIEHLDITQTQVVNLANIGNVNINQQLSQKASQLASQAAQAVVKGLTFLQFSEANNTAASMVTQSQSDTAASMQTCFSNFSNVANIHCGTAGYDTIDQSIDLV